MKRGYIVLFFVGVIFLSAQAQDNSGYEVMKPKQPTVCYGDSIDRHTYIPSPFKSNPGSRTQTATFEVTYNGFSTEAKAAFQAAVDIWSGLISSEVPIRINATWETLPAGVLGSASAGTFIRNFSGAQRQQTWYPVALAEKITGIEINGASSADIVASFNSNNNSWFYGTGGGAPTGTYDLVSIVLHEIGHGLGINHNYTVSGTNGLVSNGDFVFTYATYLENSSGTSIVSGFATPSANLKTQLESTNLFFDSPSVLTANSNARAKIYAPATFSAGSSIAHLDENTYPAGNINSLMTPQIGFTETMHSPGPIAMAMLNDMGWTRTLIKHTPIPNTETLNAPYVVKAVIDSDQAYTASSVKLHYTTNGTSFTELAMTATGDADEFSANIPSSANAITYGYFISVQDNSLRQSALPGTIYIQGSSPRQSLFTFEAGPDTKAPKIVHDAKQFLVDTDTKLVLNATVSDNIGLQSVKVEYQINGVSQADVEMILKTPVDSLYEATITFSPLLSQNDVVKYRIRAVDSSVAHNQTVVPTASTYYEVPVTGLLPVQDSYTNNFNLPSTDFFGDNLFSIQTPAGFSNGAIHSSHPYPNGADSNKESNFVYQLKVPVKLKATEAFLRFDEIVLVEPSSAGAAFGSDGFFDYVIAEGSSDGGKTWKKLVDGYNSRNQTAWLTKFNSASDNEADPNSTAVGDPTLFKAREINLIGAGNFSAGDEVVIRFRFFTDQLVHGWGWAIDNVRIQIDDIPPQLLHNHLDYQLAGNDQFPIKINVTDTDAVVSLAVDFQINNQPLNTFDFPVAAGTSDYTLNQVVTGLTKGDVFKYRIRAKDPSGNESVLPATDFFNVPVIEFNVAVAQYTADFNAANTDFVGNFFSISQPAAFNNGLISTSHPYPNGFGLDKTSSLTYMLKTPIIVNESNPFISFDEEVITESAADFVIIECSKDKGVTWQSVINAYSSSANISWTNAFTNEQNGTASLLKNRVINITSNGKFKAGDQVLVRFRLTSNAANNGWGWAIDNLSIQGPVTGIENSVVSGVQIYPNPVENGKVSLEFTTDKPALFQLSIFNMQGNLMTAETVSVKESITKKEIETNWPAGLYILKIETGDQVVSRKIIVH